MHIQPKKTTVVIVCQLENETTPYWNGWRLIWLILRSNPFFSLSLFLANKYFDACCCLLFNQTLARSYKDKCSYVFASIHTHYMQKIEHHRSISSKPMQPMLQAAVMNTHTHKNKIIEIKTKCLHRQHHQKLVDCRLNREKTTKKNEIPNEKAQYKINFRHYQCLFPYVFEYFFLFMRYWTIIIRWY